MMSQTQRLLYTNYMDLTFDSLEAFQRVLFECGFVEEDDCFEEEGGCYKQVIPAWDNCVHVVEYNPEKGWGLYSEDRLGNTSDIFSYRIFYARSTMLGYLFRHSIYKAKQFSRQLSGKEQRNLAKAAWGLCLDYKENI